MVVFLTTDLVAYDFRTHSDLQIQVRQKKSDMCGNYRGKWSLSRIHKSPKQAIASYLFTSIGGVTVKLLSMQSYSQLNLLIFQKLERFEVQKVRPYFQTSKFDDSPFLSQLT